MAGSLSGEHRLEVDKPRPFKPDEEKKHGGKVHRMDGGSCKSKLGRKRGGHVKKKRDGTDDTPDRGLKYGSHVQAVPMSGTESGYGGKTAFGKGHIEDSLKRGGHVKKKRDDGGNVTTVSKTNPSSPPPPPRPSDYMSSDDIGEATKSDLIRRAKDHPANRLTNTENFERQMAGHADGGKVNWIKKAISKPHAEQNAAKKAGMSTQSFMKKHKHYSGKSGARARLGLRLSAMHKHKD